MRILFVTPNPPSRIRVRSYGFLEQLQREHEVTIATQCARERELANVEALREQGFKVVAVQESKWREVLRSGLALPSTLPLQVAYARSARFAQTVQQLCAESAFDIVHVEHLRGIASMEGIARTYPLVWDAVDCISLLCKQTMVAATDLPVRAVAFLEYKRTQRYEASLLRQLRHTVVTSERDRKAMIRLLGNASGGKEEQGVDIDVLPNGVDLEYFRPGRHEPRPFNLVFLGKMSYHANVAAALYLYRQIMPLIWKHRPEVTLTIVGSNPPKSIRRLAFDPRVEVTGYMIDIRPFVQHAEVMLCPMIYSVGIQNKVLEAMAMGTPVVVAAQTANSLQALPGRDLLVAHSAQEFADSALCLMNSPELHAALSQRGREYVERYHNWSVVTNRLVDIYQQAIASHGGKRLTGETSAPLMLGSSSV